MARSLLQIDAAIATLREQIREGTANKGVLLIQLAELLDERETTVKATAEKNKPTTDL